VSTPELPTPETAAASLAEAVRAAAELAALLRDTPAGRIELTASGVRLDVRRHAAPEPAAAAEPAAEPPAADPGWTAVTAPLMGVFYLRPAPEEPSFVEVGHRVETGQQLAIVEAMKTMNPVLADRPGVVREIHVVDGEIVEFDQRLVSIEPVG
jgi:acetyl-CoA carboxylase biotin carboxyl carrier protein